MRTMMKKDFQEGGSFETCTRWEELWTIGKLQVLDMGLGDDAFSFWRDGRTGRGGLQPRVGVSSSSLRFGCWVVGEL